MYQFITTLHARPPEAVDGPLVEIDGGSVRTLAVAQPALAAARLDCSFEQACARLEKLPRMFCEPDGSFVWTSSADEPQWQVDGNVYDQQGRVSLVDLSGCCPAERFDELLAAFGWPRIPLVFQLTRAGVLVDEREFRQLAAASPQ